jgi:flagellar assembly protein FliH
MGLIKKNKNINEEVKNIDNQTNKIENSKNLEDTDIKESKIIGSKVIKSDSLKYSDLELNVTKLETPVFSKVIKKGSINEPVSIVQKGEGVNEDIQIVSTSALNLELEEEKNKYQELNKQLQQKQLELEEKIKEVENTKSEIINQANIKAQEIINKAIQEAQNKAQQILEQAYNQGYSQGYNEAKNKLEQEYQQKIQELQEQIKNMLNLKESLVKEMEKDIVELAIKVAEKVINKKIEEEPELVSNYLIELLPKIEQAKNITIWINPNEIEYVRLSKEKFKNLVEDVENINIAPDSRIEKGGCIIETNFGKIDARISTKLEVLKEIIFKNI